MAKQYVEIVVNIPRVAGVFHYHLPEALIGQIRPGQLVIVPFGKRTVQGVVLRFVDTPEVPVTKPVQAVVDAGVVLTPQQIELARYLAKSTLSSLAACIGLMLPGGVTQLADAEYKLLGEGFTSKNTLEQGILDLLTERGALRGRQIDRAFPRRRWRGAMRKLLQMKAVASQPVLPKPRVRPKYVRTAQLSVPPELVREGIQGLGQRETTQTRREKMLEFLLEDSSPVDVSWVYAHSGGKLNDLKKLHELGLVMLREEEAWRDPLAGLAYDPSTPPILTQEQRKAWQQVSDGINASKNGQKIKPYLLHGVTGSGKTEIYLRAVEAILQQGKQAIILVPEIALTPQTVRRFMARFPGQVGLYHSRLSEGERYDTWRRVRAGQLGVLIGPRSALFAPFPDLGLIVLDESHDDSYYQNKSPYYHARTAAVAYAQLTGAVCILGTATPDMTSYQAAERGAYQRLTLPARILAHRETVAQYIKKHGMTSQYVAGQEATDEIALPAVQVVDMRGELRQEHRSIFSRALQKALAEVLENHQQAILFLNRRGTATFVFCRDCGHTLACPNCELPLTFHAHTQVGKTTGGLVCHHCGYTRQLPKTCPQCQSERIRQYGSGTERVEAEVQTLFPDARTLRWDYESTREKGAHEIILSHFMNHRADILIGTQMLAKGLDLPLVTLVGVVLADVGLAMPDYRAGERVFQTLMQVAGRAGRSPLGGKVILQSFDPDHYVIQAAAQHDYQGFATRELAYRRQLGYPPFAELVRLLYRNPDGQKAERTAKQLAAQLTAWMKADGLRHVEMIGPAPCFYARLDGQYRWQIVLRGETPAGWIAERAAQRDLAGWDIEVNPQALL